MVREMANRRRIHGIDFSGGAMAGRKTWIASGVVDGDTLRIESCVRAEVLPGGGRERDRCLAALRAFIAGEGACAIGLDFPFGLPASLVGARTWEEFVLAFGDRYSSPERFRTACLTAAGGRELKRVADARSRAPFSPYNMRVYRQTYYGVRDVLGPLVRGRLACVLPMQPPHPGGPWVLEVCPASTLKQMSLYRPYKGAMHDRYIARKGILAAMEEACALSIASPALRQIVLDDPQGDALDSVVAALATFRALRGLAGHALSSRGEEALEGHVYV